MEATTGEISEVEPSALDRLIAGQPFNSSDAELSVLRQHTRRLLRDFNSTPEDRHLIRERLLASLFGQIGENPNVEAPLFAELGRHVFAGRRLSLGPGCTLIDIGRITLGDDVRVDAGVHMFALKRPLNPEHRNRGYAQAAPITIGDGVLIGGCAVITGGVTIGAGSTIAPGSVVVEDVPEGVYAAGNPCRVIKQL